MCIRDRAAVTWVNRCGGAKDKRAGLLMRTLGRLEVSGGLCHEAKHIKGTQNVLADGISRWPRADLEQRVREHTNDGTWSEQASGPRGESIFDTILKTKNFTVRHDKTLWSRMMGSANDTTREHTK